MPVKRSAWASVAIGPLSRAANQVVALGLTLVAVRFLSPEQFGVFALASIAITVIRTLLYSGPFEHLLKASSAAEQSSEALVSNLVIVALLSAVAAGLAMLLSLWGIGGDIALLLLILVPSNFVAAFSAWQEALILRTGRLTAYYILTFLAELLSTLVAVLLFLAQWGLYALVAQVYLRSILIALFYRLLQRPVLSDRFSAVMMRRMLLWSLPRYGSISLNLTSTYAVDLLLGAFLSPAATGIYRAGNRLVTAVSDIFSQPTRMFTLSLISKRVASNQPSTTPWTLIFTLAASVALAALAGLACVADSFVPMLMGEEWRLAAPVVSVLCIARAFQLLDAAMTPALVAHNQQRKLFLVHLVTTSLLVSLVLIFAPKGVVAVAWAVAAAAAVNTLLGLLLAGRYLEGATVSLARHLVVALTPASAVVAAVAAGSAALATSGLPELAMLAATIAIGALAWSVAMLLLLSRIRRVIGKLKNS